MCGNRRKRGCTRVHRGLDNRRNMKKSHKGGKRPRHLKGKTRDETKAERGAERRKRAARKNELESLSPSLSVRRMCKRVYSIVYEWS